ncbi:NAD(P)/FAD-dependent oxidoreductase [Streptacidiphilus jiangxiensis]|uniref:Reductase C-terminal n=1 Tax=Streptacidiphilus jiangxiensis TaxID=235985 RepID=A0A1H8APT1_STRJI|nr:FAD-dependent oxidoreductase [Streptacidiphilus jiangxiensis]SEM71984.1 Reductase C-terminal [Streptacidiphilus jiangxiensis]
MRSVLVVGASLAGLGAVRALREEGYEGTITVVGEERRLPYDRPPLSKQFLTGQLDAQALALGDADEYQDLAADWLLGARAVRLDPAARTVALSDGREVRTDAVVIATGAVARTLPRVGARALAGVHSLRTLDDAEALRADLATGRPTVAVVGAGFIGAEVASSARALGLEVTVIEAAEAPLERALGRSMGRVCASLHADHGVRLLCGVGVAGLDEGDGRVTGVRLADGRLVPADVVVVGVGARPATDWLAGSGLDLDDGVLCDAGCATNIPGVVAVGDVARCLDLFTGRHTRVEHWTSAVEQPRTAARTLLTGVSTPAPATAPYFWSDLYRSRIQFAGHLLPGDEPQVVEGDLDDRRFAAVYRRGDRAVAVLAVDQPKAFGRLRRVLIPAAVALPRPA